MHQQTQQKAQRTAAQQQAARTNGAKGGRPRKNYGNAAIRRERQLARELVLSEQLESIRFLVATRDDGGAPMADRLRAAVELLDRGEWPKKTASYVAGLDEDTIAMPKLVTVGKYTGNTSLDEDPVMMETEHSEPSTNGSETNGSVH